MTVTVTGAERALPPEVDQAAYRIVQEALTNVSRHAGQACAWVHLCYTPDALEIQVDDDGAGSASPAGTARTATAQASRRPQREPASASSACANG